MTDHVPALLRLWQIETRRSVAAWVVPFIALPVWWHASMMLQDVATITWMQTSFVMGLAGATMIPFVAGVAAWIAGRERRRGMTDLLAATPRPSIARDLANWAAVVTWSLLAYLLLAIGLPITADVLGTPGGPTLWPVAIGTLSIGLGAASGFMLGGLISSRFVPAILPIAWAFSLSFPHTIGIRWAWLKLLSPEAARWPYDHVVLHGFPAIRALWFMLWLGGLTMLCFSAIVIIRTRGRTRPALMSGAFAVAVAIASAWMLMNPASISLASTSQMVDREPICKGINIAKCDYSTVRSGRVVIGDLR